MLAKTRFGVWGGYIRGADPGLRTSGGDEDTLRRLLSDVQVYIVYAGALLSLLQGSGRRDGVEHAARTTLVPTPVLGLSVSLFDMLEVR